MDVLDRFLIKEFFMYFIFLLLGLAFLFLGIDFLSNFWGMKMSLGNVVVVYGYKVPAALQQFVPVACLMATLLVLTNMSRQNEILALYASGIGTIRITSTFIACVATISTVSFLSFDTLVPAFAKKRMFVEKGIDPSREAMLPSFNQTGFWYRSGHLVYSVGRFVPANNALEDVTVYILSSNFKLLQRVHATRAQFENNDWNLGPGYVVAYPQDSYFPISQKFTRKSGIIPEKPSDFKSLKVEEETMQLKDLRRYIRRNQEYGLDTTGQQVNYHERVALVFTPLIFVLISIPFSMKPLRNQSLPKSIAFCFLIVFLYLLLFRMVISIGKGGHIPPIVAGWATNIIFLLCSGISLVRKKG